MNRLPAGLAALLLLLAASSASAATPLPGFTLNGSNWTYRDGQFSMQGILLKPEGIGPFPALLISHGRGGNAEGFGASKAREFVKMGFVCIAPSYTHAGPVGGANANEAGGRGKSAGTPRGGKARPVGGENPAAPTANTTGGGANNPGASDENLRRATTCLDILESLAYVDAKRLAAYGNSMGAFLTVALSARAPGRIKAAAITAGGVSPREGAAAESAGSAARVPLCILHGGSDAVVPPASSARLKELLDRNHVPNERHVFEGVGHNLHQQKADEVYRLIREWFTRHGVLSEKN